MTYRIEPQLHPVRVDSLRPTQMTVGLREVARKRHAWRDLSERKGGDFLGQHMIPVVIGPKEEPWLIDHHHLARALHDEGVEHVLVTVVAQLAHLSKHEFLTFMDNRNWLHTYDAKGDRCDFADLPRRLAKMPDDPYRSLAGELRRVGGYAKSQVPYTEFLWADFLRGQVRARLLDHDFDKAVKRALKLAREPAAAHLPGWCGPSS